MLKRILSLLWCTTTVCTLALAQGGPMSAADSTYAVTTTGIELIDNSPNYTAHNVWYLMAGTPQLAQFTSSQKPDGSFVFYGLDPAGNVWGYTESQDSGGFHSSWFQIPSMGTANRKIVAGDTQVWRLATTTCTQGYQVQQWTGSAFTQWHSGCGTDLVIADQDGTAVHVNAAGNLYYSGSTGWVHLTGGGPYVSVAASSNSNILANTASGQIYRRDPSGTNTMVASGIPTPPETLGRLSTDGMGTLWFLANTTGNAYVYNVSTGAWVKPLGYAASYLSTSAPLHTFAIVGGNLYRFTEMGLQWTISLDGHYNCPPSGCPSAVHTPVIHLEFANGSDGPVDVTGPGVSPQTAVHITATATSHEFWTCWVNGFDPQYCLRRNNAPDGRVLCSIAGSVFAGSVNKARWPDFEIAYTKALRLKGQSPINCALNDVGQYICDYPVTQNCTKPPDWWVRFVRDAKDAPGWYTFAACLRWVYITNGGAHATPWGCVTSQALPAQPTPSISQSTVCTSNPQY